MTTTLIEEWARVESGRVSKRTVNTMLTPIIGFYRWAHLHGHTPTDIGALVRRPSNPRRSTLKWLTVPQLRAFLDAAQTHHTRTHALACMLALNGLRLTETLNARIEHLETVAEQRTLLLPLRKMGVADRVALPTRTVDAIALTIGTRTRGRILQASGQPLTQASVYTAFDAISTTAQIGFRVRPHMLRATFVTLSLEHGVPARDVVNSAGWASFSMLAHYDRAYGAVTRNASIPLAELIDVAPSGQNPPHAP